MKIWKQHPRCDKRSLNIKLLANSWTSHLLFYVREPASLSSFLVQPRTPLSNTGLLLKRIDQPTRTGVVVLTLPTLIKLCLDLLC